VFRDKSGGREINIAAEKVHPASCTKEKLRGSN